MKVLPAGLVILITLATSSGSYTVDDIAIAAINTHMLIIRNADDGQPQQPTLMGDVVFSSNFDENFFPNGADSYRDTDADRDTNG